MTARVQVFVFIGLALVLAVTTSGLTPAPVWAMPVVATLTVLLALHLARSVLSDSASLRGLRDEAARLRDECVELKESEARYRGYSEAIADWFWETDSEHRFCWFSEEFQAVLGVPPSRLLGKRSWDVVSERMEIDSKQWQAHITDLTAQRPFRDFKYWLEDDHGRARWIKVHGIPRFTPDGSFLGYRGTGTDITAAVENAHRMHMLNRAVEQSPVSIVITDLSANIQYVNGKFLEVTGYTAEEALGRNPRILKSEHTPPETYKAMWVALTAGDTWDGELINHRKNGELYWEFASIQPIQNIEGTVTNYLAIKTDITLQKHNEARLAKLVEDLHRSNEELEQFAYVASHDLRQPLRMISGYLGMLQKTLADSLNDDSRAFFGFAIDGAKRLDRMIVDLLEYSRIGRQASPQDTVDLNEILGDSLCHLEVAIAETGAVVTLAKNMPTLAGDRSELVRLFQNLVGNAIKYCAPDRKPVVEISWCDRGPDWVVTVRDNGIGIGKDDLQRVFGIFQRLVARDQYEGTGIGLAVCKKIAEHHGGRIWGESEPGEGSAFLVAFPKAGVSRPV
ncbi:MAG: PAS domain S-box protein [Phaeospirillum sp.]|nr:PAS domain S-box protein [Phaeospirillum sp.]